MIVDRFKLLGFTQLKPNAYEIRFTDFRFLVTIRKVTRMAVEITDRRGIVVLALCLIDDNNRRIYIFNSGPSRTRVAANWLLRSLFPSYKLVAIN